MSELRAPPETGWNVIATAPHDGTPVRVQRFGLVGSYADPVVARWCVEPTGFKCWRDEDGEILPFPPTHWRPERGLVHLREPIVGPGDRIEFEGVALSVVEVFPLYRNLDGEWARTIYCREVGTTSKDARLVALQERPSGLRKLESRVRRLRSKPIQ